LPNENRNEQKRYRSLLISTYEKKAISYTRRGLILNVKKNGGLEEPVETRGLASEKQWICLREKGMENRLKEEEPPPQILSCEKKKK